MFNTMYFLYRLFVFTLTYISSGFGCCNLNGAIKSYFVFGRDVQPRSRCSHDLLFRGHIYTNLFNFYPSEFRISTSIKVTCIKKKKINEISTVILGIWIYNII